MLAKVIMKAKALHLKYVATLAALVLVLSSAPAHAADVALPPTPINFSDYATSGMSVVTTIIGATAGVVIVIELSKSGLEWLKRAFAGRA